MMGERSSKSAFESCGRISLSPISQPGHSQQTPSSWRLSVLPITSSPHFSVSACPTIGRASLSRHYGTNFSRFPENSSDLAIAPCCDSIPRLHWNLSYVPSTSDLRSFLHSVELVDDFHAGSRYY